MRARVVVALVATLVVGLGLGYLFFGGRMVAAEPLGPTDLTVGQIYQVADFRTCVAPGGGFRYEVHFGGADRSRRNQQIPYFDGRGRRILRTTGALPPGTIRLVKVREGDPYLEGFSYGNYAWEGIIVEIGGKIRQQRRIGVCGPTR
jgi:hypothetical protein